jgi:hypothetical protein
MTNNTKTIDISEIPLTDRLSVGRQLEKNNGLAEYMGRRVVTDKVHKVNVGPRSSGELLHALTNARLSKKAVKTEEPASARHGAHLVEDENGNILGFFPGFDDNGD